MRVWRGGLATAVRRYGTLIGFLAVVLPLAMTASFALVIVLTRYRRDVSMLPASCVSQAVVVVIMLPFASLPSATAEDWSLFFVLGTFQVGAGLAKTYAPAKLEAKVLRIYRDTRFSKDKQPYKTHIAGRIALS